jgi:hypothetical protein
MELAGRETGQSPSSAARPLILRCDAGNLSKIWYAGGKREIQHTE